MLSTLSRIAFARLPSQILNILISPGGDGNLLSSFNDISHSTTAPKEFTFTSLALISSQLSILILVRYILGHVVATLLILEIAQTDGAFSDQERGGKRPLSLRSINKAIRIIYETQSLSTFSRALVIGVFYQITHYFIKTCLEYSIFRHKLLIPFAYATSSILLCKFHLIWTCATISAPRPRILSLKGDAVQKTWIRLAVPSFTYGICQALMNEAYSLIQELIFRGKEMPMSTSRRAGAEVCVVVFMLAFRLLGLLPASISLILSEASLLPGNLETIIPSPTKQRGSTIAELLGARNIPRGVAAFGSTLKAFGVPQLLWLIELHLKMCFVQIAVKLLTLPIVVFSIL